MFVSICRFFDDRTIRQFYSIAFQKNLLLIDCDAMLEMRLNVLHFQLAIELQDYDLASDLLNRIQVVFVNPPTNIEILHLPNQFYCPFIDPWIVANEKILLECLQQEKNLVFNATEQFDDVLTNLLKYQQRHFASVKLPAHLQLELLIEGNWMIDRMEECLRWCENGLHNAMTTWWQCVKNQQYPDHLPQHTRFLSTYLHHLLRDNSLCEYFSTLLERIVSKTLFFFRTNIFKLHVF